MSDPNFFKVKQNSNTLLVIEILTFILKRNLAFFGQEWYVYGKRFKFWLKYLENFWSKYYEERDKNIWPNFDKNLWKNFDKYISENLEKIF